MERAEQPVDGRNRSGVVLVPGSGFGAVMPVMEERRGDDSFQRTEPQIDVGVDEQALDALQREVGDDRRHAEAENQDRQGRRRPGDDHIDRVTSIRRQPVELRCGVVDTMESPERRDLVAHPMTPVAADLRDQQGLGPAEPAGLRREVLGHLGGHHMAGDRKDDREHGGEAERSEYLVDDETCGIGRCAAAGGRPTAGCGAVCNRSMSTNGTPSSRSAAATSGRVQLDQINRAPATSDGQRRRRTAVSRQAHAGAPIPGWLTAVGPIAPHRS